MKKIILLLVSAFIVSVGFAYTATDVAQANDLASQKIIKDWNTSPANYRFHDYIARSEIMGMVLAMVGITRNTHCRGDFRDVPKSDIDWVCRTVETAADHGFINAKPIGMKVRPYDHITRAEALSILLKGFSAEGGWPETLYYSEFQASGYKDKYTFGADWQPWPFYMYSKAVIRDDTELQKDPRANDRATRGDVFRFAYTILEAQKPTGTCGTWNNSDFSLISTMGGLDLMALTANSDSFCLSGTISHLYENNTGITWSCDSTTNRVCKTNGFSYGNKSFKVNSVGGEGKKGSLITLNVSNYPFNSIVQIQAGNYSRHGMPQLVEGFGVSADGKKITFTLPANLNGAMGKYPGESHIPDEPYAIYLRNTSNGEYVHLYNPFGTGKTVK